MRTTDNDPLRRIIGCATIALVSLGLIYVHWAAAGDVTDYMITKGQFFNQTSASSPTALTPSGFVFQAEVGASASDSVSSANVMLPNGTNRTLTFDGTNTFAFTDVRNSRTALDAAFPTGTYAFEIITFNDGTNT